MQTPYRWQQECLEKWIENRRTGIIEASTGAGKTSLAIYCMKDAEREIENVDFMIIVPTISLVRQWRRALEKAGFSPSSIGERHSGIKSSLENHILIYVVNTARYTISKDILKKQALGRSVMLIADEYHHLTSKENNLSFEFMTSPVFKRNMYASLGLTATATDIPLKEKIIPYLGPMIYSYTMSDALSDNVVAPYASYSIAIKLTPKEGEAYDETSRNISIIIKILSRRFPSLMESTLSLKEKSAYIRKHGSDDDRKQLKKLETNLRERRNIIINAENRIDTAMDIVREIDDDRTIMIFTERIAQCRMIVKLLEENGYRGVGMYHSNMEKDQQRIMLSDFRDGWIRILVCCKALDEGIDVPRADAGIFLSNSDSERQRIQRAGRLLRRAEDKEMADLYYIYVKDTVESPVFLEGNRKHVHTSFITRTSNDFENHEYNELVYSLLASMDPEEVRNNVNAIYKLARKGALSHDWLLSPEVLQDKAKHKREAYYALMGKLSKLRQSRSSEGHNQIP